MRDLKGSDLCAIVNVSFEQKSRIDLPGKTRGQERKNEIA
jgi:hypothetical protein